MSDTLTPTMTVQDAEPTLSIAIFSAFPEAVDAGPAMIVSDNFDLAAGPVYDASPLPSPLIELPNHPLAGAAVEHSQYLHRSHDHPPTTRTTHIGTTPMST